MAKWTAAMRATLRGLIGRGMTASEAGVSMGVTRNAVIGQCHRNGIPLQNAQGDGTFERERRRQKRQRLREVVAVTTPKPEPAIPGDVLMAPPDLIKQPQDGKCKWPTSDEELKHSTPTDFSCPNEPVDGEPYCEDHCDRAYGASPPRTGALGVNRK